MPLSFSDQTRQNNINLCKIYLDNNFNPLPKVCFLPNSNDPNSTTICANIFCKTYKGAQKKRCEKHFTEYCNDRK